MHSLIRSLKNPRCSKPLSSKPYHLLGLLLCALIFGSATMVLGQVPSPPPISPITGAANMAGELETALNNAEVTSARRIMIGVKVLEIETGDVKFAQNDAKLFTPASVMKLYSSAAALDHWGPNHRFKTEIATPGQIEGKVLQGGIILHGGGDPFLMSDDLRGIVKRLKDERKIEVIDGPVVVDLSLYADVLYGPGWMWDDTPDYYSMSVTPLMLDFNVLKVTAQLAPPLVDGGAKRLVAAFDPPASFPPIKLTATEGADALRVGRRPYEDAISVSGSYNPTATAAVSKRITPYHPGPWIGEVFRQMMIDAGIVIRGGVEVVYERPAGTVLLTHESAPLSEIIRWFNVKSENAIGEMLLLNLAAEKGTRPATWSAGTKEISKWLTGEVRVPSGSFRMVDGSGLSRYNLISAESTVALLQHMAAHPHAQAYLDSLPIAGGTGTMSSRLKGTTAAGRVFCKTGTMSGVSCLSGYIHGQSGKWYIFSVLTNGYVGSSAPSRAIQDKICAIIAKY